MVADEAKVAVADAYRAYYRRLVSVVYTVTGDFAEAQEVVQEAYARALDRPRQFVALDDPQAWLRTVALNFARQRHRRRRVYDRLVRHGRVRPAEDIPGLNVEWLDLARLLRQLPLPVRETLVLHHLLDLPVTEVADQMGVPVGTVKARLSRGRAKLGALLDAEPSAPPSGPPVPPVRRSVGRA